MAFFRAYQAVGTTIPTYFIESTAPNNVDDTAPAPPPNSPVLTPVDSDAAVQQIAAALVDGADPNLVVMVHGFNNPEPAVLDMYTGAATAIAGDPQINRRHGLVCVGYRWPSESMGTPLSGSWNALPTLPTWLLYFGVALVLFSFPLFYFASRTREALTELLHVLWNPGVVHIVTMLGWTIAGLVLMAVLLRAIVYFRDNYRATNYGVPDLIQVIRAIDSEIVRQHGLRGNSNPPRNVQLSFIGHSMGGFVVTNTIRTLTDVFARPVQTLNSYGVAESSDKGSEPPSNEIGNVFRLMRFVLASPDIPAETLLSSRGNFLASALARFEEAYLFSNEGDEVLRQISTLANYFVFPTKSKNHGFRLGNVEILSRNYGLIDVSQNDFLSVLRIGNLTLQELYDAIEQARVMRQPNAAQAAAQTELAKRFTYFDCTDYVDRDADGGSVRPLLSFALKDKQDNAQAKLRWYSHMRLLLSYLFNHQRPNVHGGYFEGLLSQQLIYRLACLGYSETIVSYGGEATLGTQCSDRQIRVLVSPLLQPMRAGPFVPPAGPAAQAPSPAPQAPPGTPAGAGIEVPNLVGRSIVEARAAIAAIRDVQGGSTPGAGYEPRVVLLEIAREAQQGQVTGTVLSQTPSPGIRTEPRVFVEVTVAK
jgi:hypothetical protein